MVSNIPPGWVFIGLLFIGLLAWYFRELNSCEDNENAASEQKNKANNALTRKAFKAAHNSCKAWKNHIKDPKGQIELLTLLAILVYTGLTYSVMNATKNANEISLQSFTAVQRAFVVVQDMTYKAEIGTNKQSLWSIYPIIKNSGNTPTRNLSIFYVDSVSDGEIMKKFYPAYVSTVGYPALDPSDVKKWMDANSNPSYSHKWVLGPQSEIPKGMVVPPAYRPLDLGVSGVRLLGSQRFYGIINYNDVFPKSRLHVTKFCFKMNISEGTNAPIFYPCDHWNCADEECQRDRMEYDAELRAGLFDPLQDKSATIR